MFDYFRTTKSIFFSVGYHWNWHNLRWEVGFRNSSEVKNLPASAGDVGVIPELRRFPWSRKWPTNLVFLPGKSHGQRSLVGHSPWGHKKSDTTEWLHFHFSLSCIGEGNDLYTFTLHHSPASFIYNIYFWRYFEGEETEAQKGEENCLRSRLVSGTLGI